MVINMPLIPQRTMRDGIGLLLTTVGLLVACGQSDPTTDIDRYMEQGQALNPASDSLAEWASIVNTHNQTDRTNMAREEILDMIREQLAAVTKAAVANTEALDSFRLVIPPDECQESHLLTTEMLHLREQGFAEWTSYLEQILRTGASNEDQRRAANRLMSEADMVGQRGLLAIGSCLGQ